MKANSAHVSFSLILLTYIGNRCRTYYRKYINKETTNSTNLQLRCLSVHIHKKCNQLSQSVSPQLQSLSWWVLKLCKVWDEGITIRETDFPYSTMRWCKCKWLLLFGLDWVQLSSFIPPAQHFITYNDGMTLPLLLLWQGMSLELFISTTKTKPSLAS